MVRRFVLVFSLVFSNILSAGHFTVGIEDIRYYPLYDVRGAENDYARDLLNEFGRQYDHHFTFQPLPIKRFEKWLINDNIDFRYPDNLDWYGDSPLKNKLTFSNATVQLVSGTLTRASFTRNNEPIVLGTVLGFYSSPWFELIESGKASKYENSSTTVLVKQLLSGQLDGIDIDLSVVNHQLALMGEQGAVIINRQFEYDVYHYSLSTLKHPKVIAQFDQFLKDNKKYIEGLKKKYNLVDHLPYLSQDK